MHHWYNQNAETGQTCAFKTRVLKEFIKKTVQLIG